MTAKKLLMGRKWSKQSPSDTSLTELPQLHANVIVHQHKNALLSQSSRARLINKYIIKIGPMYNCQDHKSGKLLVIFKKIHSHTGISEDKCISNISKHAFGIPIALYSEHVREIWLYMTSTNKNITNINFKKSKLYCMLWSVSEVLLSWLVWGVIPDNSGKRSG